MADCSVHSVPVSRETQERFQIYADYLIRWNKKINLVSPSTIEHIWSRHILDSVQLSRLAAEDAQHWIDLGSGGGLPGLLVAAVRLESNPNFNMTLVDSDSRKCAFMAEAARAMAVPVAIKNQRLEASRVTSLSSQRFEVISARALAPLKKLLDYAAPFLEKDSVCLFPKGKNRLAELEEARQTWDITVKEIVSLSDNEGAILRISGISSKEAAS